MNRFAFAIVPLILACAALGCGGSSSRPLPPIVNPPAGGAGVAPAKLIAVSEFTYPADGASRYSQAVQRYFKQRGKPNANKLALINRHLEFAADHYDYHLRGSKVRIFHPTVPMTKAVLATPLQAPPAPPVADVSADQDFHCGRIHYHLQGRPYEYQDGEAYVDFAARKIGGGVLGEGFVQEEIAILESNFLPWVAAVRGGSHEGTRFCKTVSLKKLDQQPVVLGVRMFLKVVKQDEIYGGKKLAAKKPFDPDRYLQELQPKPKDIYLIAMAAKSWNHQPGGRYTRAEVEAMTLLAFRGFHDAMLAQHRDGLPLVLHTGNWGAGAFGNSHLTIWAIQRAALEAAYALFCQQTGQTPPLAFHYDAFDRSGVRMANEAHNVFVNEFPANRTLEGYIDLILKKTQTDPAWQVR